VTEPPAQGRAWNARSVTRFAERFSSILDVLVSAGGCCYDPLPFWFPVEQHTLVEPSDGGSAQVVDQVGDRVDDPRRPEREALHLVAARRAGENEDRVRSGL
jgi:hypothetical protein